MKTIRFSVPSGLHTFISFVFFALLSFSIQSQTISGYVYDACTREPLEGATINISARIPGTPFGTWRIETAPDGSWDFSFFGGDPVGAYIITVSGGDSSPSSYSYYTYYGNMSGLDFNLLPDIWGITINGEEVSWQNNPSSPLTICKGQESCVQLVGTDGEPITSEDDLDYCFRMVLHSINDQGEPLEFLGRDNCYSTAFNFGWACWAEYSWGIITALEAFGNEGYQGVIHLEVQQFCCNEDCAPGEGDLVNSEVVYI